MNRQIQQLIKQLSEGKKLSLRFPSFGERERFRQALYREKKEYDDLMLMVDPEYIVQSLRFERRDEDDGDRGNEDCGAKAYLYTPADSVYRFVIDESDDG